MNKIISYWRKQKYWVKCLALFFLFSLALFIAYSKYYFADQFPMSGDAIDWLTDLSLCKNAIAQGELPFWNKFLEGGMTLTINYTPIMLLGFFPIKALVYIVYIGTVSLGATCAFIYFKKIGCNTWAAFVVAVCYLFSIHLGGARKSHALLVLTMALLPAIMCLVEYYFDTGKLRWLLGSSIVMALQFSTGFLQQVVYTDIFVGIYLIVFGVHYHMKLSRMIRHGLAWIGVYFGLIAWKLVPMLEMNQAFSAGGAVSTTEFSNFISFSIHPIKLLQTVFPQIFGEGNYFQALGIFASSEMDIELFLGHLILVFVLAGAIFLFRDFRIKIALAAMVISFLYAACGSIPFLANILYKIPLINGFRVPSRALFIFIFSSFTIAAIALSELRNEYFRRKTLILACIAFGILVIGSGIGIIISKSISIDTNTQTLYEYFRKCLLPECIFMAVSLVLLLFMTKHPIKIRKYIYQATCLGIIAITLAETLPYTLFTQPASIENIEAKDPTSQEIKDNLGDGKVWDAFAGVDGTHQSIISLNRSTSKEIPAINAYVTFNNPRLYRLFSQDVSAPLNYSGLLTGSLKADQNLHLQNSLLSMLGVNYIIDSSGLLEQDSSSYSLGEDKTIIAQKESILLPYYPDNTSMYFELFPIENNCYYEFSAKCFSDSEQTIYFDLYGGPEYDNSAQQVEFHLSQGMNELKGMVNSGDLQGLDLDKIYWRIVSTADIPLELTDVSFKKLDLKKEDDTYRLWLSNGDTPIYENTKARGILYVPDRVEKIKDEELLYQDTWLYQLDRVNYSSYEESRVLNPETVKITSVDFKYNRINAHISSDEDTVIDFSQCWYPGWHAYANGDEIPVKIVNNLIMGVDLPNGETELSFSYIPTTLFVSLAFSLFVLIAVIFLFGRIKLLEKKNQIR